MSIRTILFDLDGTLIDTNELIIASFMHTFSHYGMTYTREEVVQFNGPPLLDTFQKIAPDLAEEMVKTYRAHNLTVHDSYVTAFPHVTETIAALKEQGLKLGIVSTKMRKGVNMGLTLTGLATYMDTIITLDDVTQAKPHPEPVLKAVQALGADLETTLMVGDNYHDIESGKNAGVKTAGVAWSDKGSSFLEGFYPTYMLKDMRDLLQLTEV
ncbi:pyrophosphatase PpaX [Oceanobacillus jordanicus]|uniref:Pyrophosphatase PpaX n=1 Tax=Oceanobacillus jordanicus TaxID=2867266 RepID=A0AAW5BCC5_9BACI|nr:pyrophosphatase PpaX [Oceanobacillus jordanicus]MCG3420544.1 pyrophosphatase PpaX [Oceanobacillus jordanicus]NAP00018.1 pyrophosphatase PpaX [Halomonas sp. MG34]